MENPAAASAIRAGDIAQLRDLLAQDSAISHATDDNGVSLVMLALYHRQVEALKLLVAAKPDLDWFEAAATGDTARMAQLLDSTPALISSFSADGFTALHFAAFFAEESATLFLLDRGADVAAVAKNATHVMPLHSAATGRNLAVVRALLERHAPVDARQQKGWTPLHAAAQSGNRLMAELLLQYGADRTFANDERINAADLARKGGHTELADLLK